MAKKKKEQEIQYRFVTIEKCTECGTEIEKPEPCPKCKNDLFNYILKVIQIREDDIK